MQIERNINQIFTNKLFLNCSNQIQGFGLNNRNFTEFKEGDVIFQAGDSSNFIYLVISGEVKIKFRNANRLQLRSNDDFFGDYEIIKDTNRYSSAVAISDCVLYRIDKNTFKKLSAVENQILENIKSSEGIHLQEDGESKPKPDISSMLNLDRSPIKLDIFKRKKKEETSQQQEEEIPAKQNDVKAAEKTVEIEPENPDLDSVIEESKKNKEPNESLKKELLGDAEDFDNWNFTTVDSPKSDVEEKIEFEKNITTFNEEIVEKKLTAKHEKELEELRTSLAKKYDINIQAIFKILPGITVSETYEKIISAFSKQFNSNFSYLFLVNDKSTDLELIYPESAKPLVVKYNEGITGRSAATKRIFVVRNPAKDIRYNAGFDKPKDFTEGSVAYIPLNDSESKLIGMIQLGRVMKDFSKENEDTMQMMAQQAGVMIKHAIMNEDQMRLKKLSAFGSISKFLMNDIKSPILTIKHYSNLISRIDIPDQIKKVLTMLSMQANSVVDIMQSTFDFAENNISLKLHKTEFNEMMKNILELLSEYTESKNVKLFKKFGEEAVVNIDARRFYVVCFQIIKNACEAMSSGGKIFVVTELNNNTLQLNIRDEGPGISNEIKNDIFNAFFSAGKENAAGLGLSVAKFIVEKMNGTISFESNPKEGTAFKIILPIVKD